MPGQFATCSTGVPQRSSMTDRAGDRGGPAHAMNARVPLPPAATPWCRLPGPDSTVMRVFGLLLPALCISRLVVTSLGPSYWEGAAALDAAMVVFGNLSGVRIPALSGSSWCVQRWSGSAVWEWEGQP